MVNLSELGKHISDLDDHYSIHDAAITKLESAKIDEFKHEVTTHLGEVEARLGGGGGGQTNIDEVKALRSQVDTYGLVLNDVTTQITHIKRDITDQRTWTSEQKDSRSGPH